MAIRTQTRCKPRFISSTASNNWYITIVSRGLSNIINIYNPPPHYLLPVDPSLQGVCIQAPPPPPVDSSLEGVCMQPPVDPSLESVCIQAHPLVSITGRRLYTSPHPQPPADPSLEGIYIQTHPLSGFIAGRCLYTCPPPPRGSITGRRLYTSPPHPVDPSLEGVCIHTPADPSLKGVCIKAEIIVTKTLSK